MNCANHPERTATAFCQNCGKPLCAECTRSADGLILCEPCLHLRQTAYAGAAGAPGSAAAGVPGGFVGGAGSGAQTPGWSRVPPMPTPVSPAGFRPVLNPAGSTAQASPVLAALLGFIPGVGAMYNGQFVKALLHVIIFIVLIGISEHLPLVGILIGAWVFYQVFDAAQTASARHDGRPLPDPFGILDMSQRLGPQQPVYPAYHPTYPGQPPSTVPAGQGSVPTAASAAAPASNAGVAAEPGPASNTNFDPAAQARSEARPFAPVTPPGYQYPPFSSPPHQAQTAYVPLSAIPQPQRRSEPIGAIVLIVVGLLFLLSTLGVLDFDWIGRGWPLILLLLGVWLLIRRVRTPQPLGVPGPAGAAQPAPTVRSMSLSITPQPGISHDPLAPGTPADEETR